MSEAAVQKAYIQITAALPFDLANSNLITLAMTQLSAPNIPSDRDRPDEVFDLASELFRVLSAPMRLKIISCLCDGERNVTDLVSKIGTTQPNMSQHLNTLYKSGVLGKRRDGVQIYYRIIDERIPALCRAVCAKIETEGNFKAV